MQGKQKEKFDILIVDDDPSLQVLISEILKMEGYTYHIAQTGKEAFAYVMNNAYKLILMDMKMPEWDGLTAIRSLDCVQQLQKVIVVSAYLDSEMLQALSKEPLVVGWLEKPFDPIQLIEMIHKVIPVDSSAN